MTAPQDWEMPNGKHAGTRIARVPASYLLWMVNVRHTFADRAQTELDRRGTVRPEMDISGHAIDRASLMLRRTWHETSAKDEGLHAWLVRMATDALKQGEQHPEQPTRYEWQGMSFRFELDGAWPVLKTVLPGRRS